MPLLHNSTKIHDAVNIKSLECKKIELKTQVYKLYHIQY